MLGRGTNAAGSAAEAGRTALRLALVVLEDEQVVGAELHFRAQQGLIGRRTAPVALTIRRPLHNIVISADRLVAVALGRTAQHIVREALAVIRVSTEHKVVRDQEQTQAYKDESYPRGKHLLLLLGCQIRAQILHHHLISARESRRPHVAKITDLILLEITGIDSEGS